MSHALPYLRRRQNRTTHLTLRYTFDQLVQAPQEQHSREYTWPIGGPPSPTACDHISIGTIWMWLVKIYSTYRLLGKTKVSKFQLSSRFSWGIQQVFRLQVSGVEMILQILYMYFFFQSLWYWRQPVCNIHVMKIFHSLADLLHYQGCLLFSESVLRWIFR